MTDRPDLPHQPCPPRQPFVSHLPYLAFFAVLTVFLTWPLASILTTGVIGGAGDNLSFVWNFWWAQTALAAHQSVFWTPDILAPFGTSLATHTFVPLLTVSAGWLLTTVPPLTLYNGALLASVFLNCACAYWAAFAISRDRPASAFAAITFAASPFLLVRLAGHLNVVSAWGLPLAFAMTIRHQRKPSPASAALLAAALGAVAYTDYYLFIFTAVVVALAMTLSQWAVTLDVRARTPTRRRVLTAILTIAGIIALMIAWTAATGGTDTTIAGFRLRMTDTFNMRVALGFLVVAGGLTWTWPKVRATLRAGHPDPKAWWLLAMTAAILAVVVSPLLLAAARLWQSGDYSSQAYVWRNAPPGIDLASLLLGNQLHPLTGALTTRVYHHFGINPIEGAAWLGVVPIALAVLAVLRLRGRADVQAAFWIGGVFLIWSLGPYLRVLDYNTGLMLPQTLLRYVPIAANARIPGRAFVVVQLMVAIAGALALSSLRTAWPSLAPRATAVVVLAIGGVLVDYWPATRAWAPIEAPPIYRALKDLPPGILLNVPLGFRDGFGARGNLDDRVLFYQTVHEHPQMGGFVARLSKRVESAYDSDPIVSRLLDLSEGLPAAPFRPDDTPCQSSLACSVKYIVVDKTLASGELIAFVADSFSLKRIDQSGASTLYAVTAVPACRCETTR